jgi:hypothetical protein
MGFSIRALEKGNALIIPGETGGASPEHESLARGL